jgi:DNA-binding transcriptional LysR family regulator
VHVSVEVMDRRIVEEKLVNKEIHLGVLGMCSKKKEIECWPLWMDELVLIVAANHPWTARASVKPSELREADWILREKGAATRQVVLDALAEQGIAPEDLRVAMELGSAEGVEAAVEAGHGISFVSRVAAERGLELGRIKTIPVEGVTVQRVIYLARNHLRTCTCAQLRFREFIESAAGQQSIATLLGA